MIIEGEFFSGEHLRWNLGWPTPNYAGAFLVPLLALLWIYSDSRWRWAALTVEAGGLFLLAKTYSRGAIVAWGLAWLFGVAASRGWKLSAERLVWATRAGVLAVMLLVTGFGWSRLAESGAGATMHGTSASTDAKQEHDESDVPASGREAGGKLSGEATEDGSVVNRLALWRGGLQMIAAAPWTGWGAGESGRAYMNWYQDLDRDEGYASMVNSYLHVAVERGLPVLVAVLWVAVWFILVAWRGTSDESNFESGALGITRPALMSAVGASLVGWLVANVFTTLWIEPKLWVVPALAGLALIWNARNRPAIRLVSAAGVGLVIAVCTTASLYGAGRFLRGKESIVSFPGINRSVALALTGTNGAVWHAWPDPVVLGATPGKELRRWLDAGSANVRLITHRAAPLELGEFTGGAEGVLLFGRQAERIGRGFAPDCRELWLIHPTVSPPVAANWTNLSQMEIMVILPQIDELGNGPAWRRWAKENNARVVESPACGLDIRAVWPTVPNAKTAIGSTADIAGPKNGLFAAR